MMTLVFLQLEGSEMENIVGEVDLGWWIRSGVQF